MNDADKCLRGALPEYLERVNNGGPGSGCHGDNCGRPSGSGDAQDSKAVAKTDKAVSKTWMQPYGWKPELREKSDGWLKATQKSFGNDVAKFTEEQKAMSSAIYREQRYRYEKAKQATSDQYDSIVKQAMDKGHWPDGREMPKAGDKVYQTVAGLFGTPASIQGEVFQHGKQLRVRVTGGSSVMPMDTGAGKTHPLSPQWTKVGDKVVAQRAAEREAKQKADEARIKAEHDAHIAELTAKQDASVAKSLAEGHERVDANTLKVGDEIYKHWDGTPEAMVVTDIGDDGKGNREIYATEKHNYGKYGGGYLGRDLSHVTRKRVT